MITSLFYLGERLLLFSMVSSKEVGYNMTVLYCIAPPYSMLYLRFQVKQLFPYDFCVPKGDSLCPTLTGIDLEQWLHFLYG